MPTITKLHAATFAALTFAALAMFGPLGERIAAQPPQGKGGKGGFGKAAPKQDPTPRGLRLKSAKATPGYVLFAPLTSNSTYLIDMDGRVVKTWESDRVPAGFVYMLENGHVIRGGEDLGQSGFTGGGSGGRIQEWDFDGKLVWDFQFNQGRLLHHDIAMLPNGNVLAIVWEKKTPEEARAAGMHDDRIPASGVWTDALYEFQPQRPKDAKIVWEWHAWDHFVKSEEAAAHPERIDPNGASEVEPFAIPAGAGFPAGPGGAGPPGAGPGGPGAAKGKAKGGPGGGAPAPQQELFHMNAVFYNAKFDQVMVSIPHYNEIWILDHSTTTEQAKGSAGGKSGKGGDLLYRWGNPVSYGRGTQADRFFGFEHDARWIPDGTPGAGNIMVFSNRSPGANGSHTRLYEIAPPVDAQGRYTLAPNAKFGPIAPVWTYAAPDFDANFISGAFRQKNGNTLVSSGPQGRMFEITPSGEIVWEYWSPYRGDSGLLAQIYPYALFRGQKLLPDDPALKGRVLRPVQ